MEKLSRREFLKAVVGGVGALFATRTASEIEKTGKAVTDLLGEYNVPLEQVIRRVLEERDANKVIVLGMYYSTDHPETYVRLEAALEAYRRLREEGLDPLLVVYPDEDVVRRLAREGVDYRILPRFTGDTEEELLAALDSLKKLDMFGVIWREVTGRDPRQAYVLAVTSDYHAPKVKAFMDTLGIRGTVLGVPTPYPRQERLKREALNRLGFFLYRLCPPCYKILARIYVGGRS